MLQMVIPEESKGMSDKIVVQTNIQLETYNAQHTLNDSFNFKYTGISA
jgi:hypothetical protein